MKPSSTCLLVNSRENAKQLSCLGVHAWTEQSHTDLLPGARSWSHFTEWAIIIKSLTRTPYPASILQWDGRRIEVNVWWLQSCLDLTLKTVLHFPSSMTCEWLPKCLNSMKKEKWIWYLAAVAKSWFCSPALAWRAVRESSHSQESSWVRSESQRAANLTFCITETS